MPVISARIDYKLHNQLEEYCKRKHIKKTDAIKLFIQERISEYSLDKDDGDWRVSAANLLGITIGQLTYAISASKSSAEAISRLSSKSDAMELLPINEGTKIAIQASKGTKYYLVTTEDSANINAVVGSLLKQLIQKTFEDADADAIY